MFSEPEQPQRRVCPPSIRGPSLPGATGGREAGQRAAAQARGSAGRRGACPQRGQSARRGSNPTATRPALCLSSLCIYTGTWRWPSPLSPRPATARVGA